MSQPHCNSSDCIPHTCVSVAEEETVVQCCYLPVRGLASTSPTFKTKKKPSILARVQEACFQISKPVGMRAANPRVASWAVRQDLLAVALICSVKKKRNVVMSKQGVSESKCSQLPVR